MKFAPSFTLTSAITLFNMLFLKPHQAFFRIWVQCKKLISSEELIINFFLFDYRNLPCFTCLQFISMALKYDCNLLTSYKLVICLFFLFYQYLFVIYNAYACCRGLIHVHNTFQFPSLPLLSLFFMFFQQKILLSPCKVNYLINRTENQNNKLKNIEACKATVLLSCTFRGIVRTVLHHIIKMKIE